jgi:hypothetical protein
LKGASGHLKRLGRLTQGESLGLQSKILIEEVRTLGSIPAWVMISIASLRVLNDGSHGDLLFHPSPVYCRNGSGWRGRQLLSTLTRVESLIFRRAHCSQVAGPMIEARTSIDIVFLYSSPEMAVRIPIAFTYLPGFVTAVLRGMTLVRIRHTVS